MDEKDFVFVNKVLSEKEEKEFSDFLKTRKEGSIARKRRSLTRRRKKYVLNRKS